MASLDIMGILSYVSFAYVGLLAVMIAILATYETIDIKVVIIKLSIAAFIFTICGVVLIIIQCCDPNFAREEEQSGDDDDDELK